MPIDEAEPPVSKTPAAVDGDIEDREVVASVLAGRDEAFAGLVDRYKGSIYAIAYSALRSSADAQDAAGEAFLLAYRRLNELHDGGRFGPWIRRIAYTVSAKALARRRFERSRMIRMEDVPEPAQNIEELAMEFPPPVLKRAIAGLSPEDRAAVTLFYLLDMDQRQIASDLNIPVGTVKSRLARARRQLERSIVHMSKNPTIGIESDDYGRSVISGNRGEIHWQKLLGPAGLEGWTLQPSDSTAFVRQADALIGTCEQKNQSARLSIGSPDWSDYELSLLLTPVWGCNAQVLFRISEDGQRYYMFDMLLAWKALAISEVDLSRPQPVRKLSVVNFPVEMGREYDVMIAARESSLTTYVDGKLYNQVTDTFRSHGAVALNVWQSKTAYRDIRIRMV